METYGTINMEPLYIGEYKGLKYFIIPSPFLTLNGYVELPKDWKDGKEDWIDVNGGVTFKGYVRDGSSKVKVIGFDTLHLFNGSEDWRLPRVEEECKHLIDGIIEAMKEDNEETEDEE